MSADAVPAGPLPDPFAASHDIFETLVGWLGHPEAAALTAAELEERLQVQSREVSEREARRRRDHKRLPARNAGDLRTAG